MLTFILNSDFTIRKSDFKESLGEDNDTGLRGSKDFLSHVSSRDRTQVLEWLHTSRQNLQGLLYFSMINHNFCYVHVCAQVTYFETGDTGFYCLSANLIYGTPDDQGILKLSEDIEFYKTIISNATEALWCIEFQRPVDLTKSIPEIIDQVFENQCWWRICNAAVSKLYGVPDEVDINAQPVSRYFSKSATNIRYVRRLIATNFWIDDAISIDLRHDGSTIFVENTVRSKIVNNRLIRFWGTMHDVTQAQKTYVALRNNLRMTEAELCAAPIPMITLDMDHNIIRITATCEKLMGITAKEWIGQHISELLIFDQPLKRTYPKNEMTIISANFVDPYLKILANRSVQIRTIFIKHEVAGLLLTFQLNPSVETIASEPANAI